MRKRIIAQGTQGIIFPVEDWLDLETSAQAETTSEDASHPIESALKPGVGSGWRASEPGQQTVRLLFDKPCGSSVFISPDISGVCAHASIAELRLA